MEGDDEASLKGQTEIWKILFSYADSMALKCAVELRIADIILSHGGPITLRQIAGDISDAPSPDIPCLERIMRLLVRRKIFSGEGSGEKALYGLTHSSRWLMRDDDLTLAPFVLLADSTWIMDPWHCLSACVKHGGIAFERAHGKETWDVASENGAFNELFNTGMESMTRIVMRAILESDIRVGVFGSLRTLVDVGGGTGLAAAEIIRSQPHIGVVNFDLPHVIATAPAWAGVKHVSGDMFESIPSADTVFMKSIMHDWNDEDCVKILKNCRKAIPVENGKVIIVDVVLEEEDNNGLFDDTALVFDLAMLANTSGGKERTQTQWEYIFKQAGFPHYKVIKIPALPSVIEAYPI